MNHENRKTCTIFFHVQLTEVRFVNYVQMEPDNKGEVKDLGRKLKKFGSSTNVDDVIKGVRMTDKTVVITGGNSGIGELTVQAFAEMGAHVYVSCL